MARAKPGRPVLAPPGREVLNQTTADRQPEAHPFTLQRRPLRFNLDGSLDPSQLMPEA
ncbi:MAG: hypothetical protein RB191_13975 [Terriglobia bacterium]|nr:hypothetical protein [Terriglobia bacterium]